MGCAFTWVCRGSSGRHLNVLGHYWRSKPVNDGNVQVSRATLLQKVNTAMYVDTLCEQPGCSIMYSPCIYIYTDCQEYIYIKFGQTLRFKSSQVKIIPIEIEIILELK